MTTYLRTFSERVVDVPGYLRRHLALIRDLDEKVQALQKEIEVQSKRKLLARTASDTGGGPSGKRQRVAEPGAYDLDSAVTRLLSLADEKVHIAAQVYDFIDKHIKHLDEDLKSLAVDIEAGGGAGAGPSSARSADMQPATAAEGRRGAGSGAGGGAAALSGVGTRRKQVTFPAVDTAAGQAAGPGSARGNKLKGGPGSASGGGGSAGGRATKKGSKQSELASAVAAAAAAAGDAEAPAVILTEAPGEHEPLYCTCQRPSQGNMVACDNDECPYEWFHYECVGLTEAPNEAQEWFCPICAPAMKLKREQQQAQQPGR